MYRAFPNYKLFLVLALSALLSTARAQVQDTTTVLPRSYIGISTGVLISKVYDGIVSPLDYTGGNFYFQFNYQRERKKSLQEIYLRGTVGSLQTDGFSTDILGGRFRPARSQFYWFEPGYSYMHRVGEEFNNNAFYLGGSAYLSGSVRYNERWDNSAINYDGTAMLALQGQYLRKLKFPKREAKAGVLLSLPVIGAVFRPKYTGVTDFVDHETGFFTEIFQDASFAWIGNYPRIRSRLFLDYPIRAGNRLVFSYEWDYYSFQDPFKVQGANHIFSVNFLMNI